MPKKRPIIRVERPTEYNGRWWFKITVNDEPLERHRERECFGYRNEHSAFVNRANLLSSLKGEYPKGTFV